MKSRARPVILNVRAPMRKRTIAAIAATPLLGLLLFGMSAPSCGCEEPWMDFLMVFGVESWSVYDNLDGKVMTAAAQNHLVGTSLSKVKFPAEIQPSSCRQNNQAGLDCEFWFLSGLLRDGGFHVVMKAKPDGAIETVKVTNLQRILGSWEIEQ